MLVSDGRISKHSRSSPLMHFSRIGVGKTILPTRERVCLPSSMDRSARLRYRYVLWRSEKKTLPHFIPCKSEPHLAGKSVVYKDIGTIDFRSECPDRSRGQQIPIVLRLEEFSQRFSVPLDVHLNKAQNSKKRMHEGEDRGVNVSGTAFAIVKSLRIDRTSDVCAFTIREDYQGGASH